MSFVFAATCQEFLGSCIFLFVKHPFDIGDRVDVTEEKLVVERISLLYTVFKRVSNGKLVQIPNIVLNNLWVDNITRSKAMREQISIFVHFETSFEDIKALKDEMHTFVTDKENNRDYLPDIDIEVIGIAELNKMELRIEIKHKSNWANESIRAARRSKFMCALVLALRRVPIYAPGGGDAGLGSADAPAYSVTLSPEQAQDNKAAFAKKKENKRIINSKPTVSSPKLPTTGFTSATDFGDRTEMDAIQTITARSMAVDSTRDDTWVNRDDISTLGAPTMPDHDRISVEETRGLLNREASRGHRRPNMGLNSSDEPLPARGPSTVTYASPPAPPGTLGASPPNNYAVPPSFQGPPSGYGGSSSGYGGQQR
jgi:small-conductance mechanosensitive channel